MEYLKQCMEAILALALFFNAALFIPQALQLFRTKSTQGLSLLTFGGFLIIQSAVLIHGLLHQDYILAIGYLLSILSCGTVVLLGVYYRKSSPPHMEDNAKVVLNKLQERLVLLEQIIALMPGHVYWVDTEGFYLGCNDKQARSAGLHSRLDIIGKKNRDLPWNSNADTLPEVLDQTNLKVIQTGKTLVLEEPAILQDGTVLHFLSSKVPIPNQKGQIIAMLGISIDITDRKKAELALRLEKNKAEAANQAKTEFLENMRHDIRTALTGIVGISECLNFEDNPKIRQLSRYLNQSSQELLRFLNEVLDSIQVATGQIPLLQKPFSLQGILQRLIQLHQPLAFKKGLALKLDCDLAIPACLIGDPVRIYRILLELLANALKFTHQGSVEIIATLAKKEAQKVVLKILVRDTGIGIPPEKQEELFLHFKRLTPSCQGIYKGLGLGLATVKQFIEDIQGEIYLQSELGRGTEALCLIPLQAPLLKTPPFYPLKTDAILEGQTQKLKPKKKARNLIKNVRIAALASLSANNAQSYECQAMARA